MRTYRPERKAKQSPGKGPSKASIRKHHKRGRKIVAAAANCERGEGLNPHRCSPETRISFPKHRRHTHPLANPQGGRVMGENDYSLDREMARNMRAKINALKADQRIREAKARFKAWGKGKDGKKRLLAWQEAEKDRASRERRKAREFPPLSLFIKADLRNPNPTRAEAEEIELLLWLEKFGDSF